MVGIRSFPFGANGLFSGAFAVSFREGILPSYIRIIYKANIRIPIKQPVFHGRSAKGLVHAAQVGNTTALCSMAQQNDGG